jgi:hypothetical protein
MLGVQDSIIPKNMACIVDIGSPPNANRPIHLGSDLRLLQAKDVFAMHNLPPAGES